MFTISNSQQKELHRLDPDMRRARLAEFKEEYEMKVLDARMKAKDDLDKRMKDMKGGK